MVTLRSRVNILSLSLAQVKAFTAAMTVLKMNGVFDGFIKRHMTAMVTPVPAGSQSNAAHSGPLFLPWHRAALWEFETAVLALAPSLPGLPYWRWEAEAGLNGGDPRKSKLWTTDYFGTDGDPAQGNRVLNGPFKSWQALLWNNTTSTFTHRASLGLIRKIGRDTGGSATLPDQTQVTDLNTYATYDVSPYGPSTSSFRSRLEGWNAGPRLHNQVHRWVGGDMLVGTSPNDPTFWVNHCNVDRLWWSWQNAVSPRRPYLPVSPAGPVGQRSGDVMKLLKGTTWTPASVQDIHDVSRLGYDYA